jgi:Family of unknown function (DUF6491)
MQSSARRLIVAVAAATSALAATVANAQPPARHSNDQCFVRRNINGFSAPNDRTVYIRVGVSDVWRLDLMIDCTGLAFRNAFALEARPATAWICSPLDATVIVRQTGISQRCPVSAMHKLTPDEIAALPKRDRP